MLYVTVLTGSRGGFLSLIIAIIVYFYFYTNKRTGKIKNTLKGVTAALIILIIFLANDLMYTRITETSETLSSDRIPLWNAAFQIVKDDLIFGVGVFKFQMETPKFLGKLSAIHNEYLTILVYSGLTGLFLYLYFLYKVIKSAYYVNKYYNNPVFLSVGAIILFTLFKGGGMLLSVIAWFMLALIYSSISIGRPSNALIYKQHS